MKLGVWEWFWEWSVRTANVQALHAGQRGPRGGPISMKCFFSNELWPFQTIKDFSFVFLNP